MTAKAQSLFARHPKRWDVPVLLVLSAAALATGYALPLMAISKLVFWKDDYTLITSVTGLWHGGNYVLAVVIFLFSIIFPCTKLVALAVVWWKPFESEARERFVFWVGVLGKWSMLDVFVCALLIVLTQSKGYIDASPRVGLFVFAGAIALSMITSIVIERLVKAE